jgi:hypothetical protein
MLGRVGKHLSWPAKKVPLNGDVASKDPSATTRGHRAVQGLQRRRQAPHCGSLLALLDKLFRKEAVRWYRGSPAARAAAHQRASSSGVNPEVNSPYSIGDCGDGRPESPYGRLGLTLRTTCMPLR